MSYPWWDHLHTAQTSSQVTWLFGGEIREWRTRFLPLRLPTFPPEKPGHLAKLCSHSARFISLCFPGVYSVKKHTKYLNGEWSEDRCLQEFLKTFDTKNNSDGVVSISLSFIVPTYPWHWAIPLYFRFIYTPSILIIPAFGDHGVCSPDRLRKSTAPSFPRRSPIQVLTGLHVA